MAAARAARGEFELARHLMLQAISDVGEAPLDYYSLRAFGLAWDVAATQGDWETAERELRCGFEGLSALGATAVLSTVAALLAHSLYRLGRDEEAEQMAAVSSEATAKDDILSQVLWRTARARVLTRRGDAAEAIALAREAVALALESDELAEQGDASTALAEALHAVGETAEARAAAADALRAYERKEHLVGADRARALIAELEAATAYETSTGS